MWDKIQKNNTHKCIGSVQFSRSVVSNSLWPPGLQHARPPCPSPTPGTYSNSCPLNRWCHPTISSSVITFSSCLQSFLASESFQISQFFTSGGQSVGVSASGSVLPMNTQDWFPLGWTGWISLQSKGLSRVLGASTGDPIHDKVMWKRPDKQGFRTQGIPQTCSSIYPRTRICLSYHLVPFTNSSDINRGLSPTTFLWRKST